ncbi:MAG: SprB repeat-containing protein [Lewinellaceae bacterium]|nr:SprB repeat-containing protein [Lewinellaceae bacterium]
MEVNVLNIQNVLCPQDMTGSAEVKAMGGIPPYSYFWSSGSPVKS